MSSTKHHAASDTTTPTTAAIRSTATKPLLRSVELPSSSVAEPVSPDAGGSFSAIFHLAANRHQSRRYGRPLLRSSPRSGEARPGRGRARDAACAHAPARVCTTLPEPLVGLRLAVRAAVRSQQLPTEGTGHDRPLGS